MTLKIANVKFFVITQCLNLYVGYQNAKITQKRTYPKHVLPCFQ